MGSQSNLADAVRLLDRCTEDEIRQLHAMLSVKLGETTVENCRRPPAGKGIAAGTGGRGGLGRRNAASGKARPSKKGNPQRRSQYETHPAYKAYKAAKKAAEDQAKADKVRFADLKGEVAAAYRTAFSQWLEAKCLFRRSGAERQETTSQPKGSDGSSKTAHRSPPADPSQSKTATGKAKAPQQKSFAEGSTPAPAEKRRGSRDGSYLSGDMEIDEASIPDDRKPAAKLAIGQSGKKAPPSKAGTKSSSRKQT